MGKEFTEVKRAYLAGFLDADGAIMACIEKHQEMKFRFRIRVVVKITQKNREILDSLKSEYQVGLVVQNRTTYDWIIKDQAHVLQILSSLEPFLQVKKSQADLAMKIVKMSKVSKSDLELAAQLADALSRLNVRSENRRKNYAVMVQVDRLP